MPLPRVLILDDQFGRCGLGREFRLSVGDDLFAGYAADRRALCTNFGLIDTTEDVETTVLREPLAEAHFCPAQVWEPSSRCIENSVSVAVEAVRKGWPFLDGSRWALVLVDLRFTHGKLDSFGDPSDGSLFGAEILIPELRREFGPDLPLVVLSSTDRDENNVMVRRAGALDFIQRVPGAGEPPERSMQRLQDAMYSHALVPDQLGIVVGHSLPILKMLRQARRGARAARTILLQGETGTGKGLVARYIHCISARAEKPFETFNAAFRPAELQADELFGHWKGAFDGAREDAKGVWERADCGTIFIDEVADLDEKVQQRLMPAIEEKKIRRLGHPPKDRPAEITVDVRVILATNRRLDGLSTVKLDFLNRINAFEIGIPPLRDRTEDLPELAQGLAKQLFPNWTGSILPEAIQVLRQRSWKIGNVRELRNTLEKAIASNPNQVITAFDVHQEMDSADEVQDSHIHSIAAPVTAPVHHYESVPIIEQPRETESDLIDGGQFEPILPAEGIPTWFRLIDAVHKPPGSRTRDQWAREVDALGGMFPELIAAVLAWALEATKSERGFNYTAAARLLLGRKNITTVEAKQLLRRILSLDVRGQTVLKHFQQTPQAKAADALGLNDIETDIDEQAHVANKP